MSSSSTMSSRRPLSRDYDTGFPESLASSTTSWRHPEANTAPDACITAEDIDPAKAIRRHRRSFLHHKYKRTTSHGFIVSHLEQEYLSMKGSMDPPDSAIDLDDGTGLGTDDDTMRRSKDETESIDREDGLLKDRLSPVPHEPAKLQQSPESPRRRGSLFRKIMSGKH